MRITIDTEAHDAVPVVNSTSSETSASAFLEGGGAPAAMQAEAGATAPGNSAAAISAGPPSADLVAAILAASPTMSALQGTDGGAAPN